MAESEAVAFLIALFIIGVPGIVVFGLVCRLLWHAGSWFKRKDRR